MAKNPNPPVMAVQHHYYHGPFNVMLRTANVGLMGTNLPSILEDKIAVKKYVDEKLGAGYTPRQFAHSTDYNEVIAQTNEDHYMLKLNKFSGHNSRVDHGVVKDPKRLSFPDRNPVDGRWWFDAIKPTWFSEELISDAPVDYKWHCYRGVPLFCQVLYNRHLGKVEETCVLPSGEVLPWNIDLAKSEIEFTKPKGWEEMIEVATALSAEMPYVRVDLYSTDKVSFGELTVLPGRGLLMNIEGSWNAWMLADAVDDMRRGIPPGQKQ